MIYLNEGLKQFLLLSDIELKKRISDHKGNLPVKDYILAGALFGVIGAATLSAASEEYQKSSPSILPCNEASVLYASECMSADVLSVSETDDRARTIASTLRSPSPK